MTQPIEMLRQARDLVARGWCQGISARREDGGTVNSTDKSACAFCTTGALTAAMWHNNNTWDALHESYAILYDAIAEAGYNMAQSSANIAQGTFHGVCLNKFNDTLGRTQAEVVAVFDQALAKEAS